MTCVNGDWTKLNELDEELAVSKDNDAPEIRIGLLFLTLTRGQIAERVLSILTQASKGDRERRAIGHFTRLKKLPAPTDLDSILDGAGEILTERHYSQNQFELRSIFEEWLARRLADKQPIQASRLAVWLRAIRLNKESHDSESDSSLSHRFKLQPTLFEETFEALQAGVGAGPRDFRTFVMHDFWQIVPSAQWPQTPAVFFLKRAKKETNAERAAILYSLHAANFPDDTSAFDLAEEGLAFVEDHADVRAALGESWNAPLS